MCIIHSQPCHTDEGHFEPPPPSLGPALCGLALPFGYLCAFGATAEPLHRLTEQKQFRSSPLPPMVPSKGRQPAQLLRALELLPWQSPEHSPWAIWQNRPVSVLFCLLMVRNLEGSVRCGSCGPPSFPFPLSQGCTKLVENNADVNARDGSGRTAVMYGAKHGHTKVSVCVCVCVRV